MVHQSRLQYSIIPFSLLYKLQLRPKMKIGVYSVLMLGCLDIAFTITRYITVAQADKGGFLTLVCR